MPDITISLTVPQATRLQAALQYKYPNETIDLVFAKQEIARYLRSVVQFAEVEQAVQTVRETPVADFEPT